MLGSVRSGMGALRAALDAGGPTLAVLSDVRTGLPGGGDERDGGDAAAAFSSAGRRGRGAPRARAAGSSGRARRRRSSWTAGGCPATGPRASGRSASASRCTCRWPRRPDADALKQAGLTAGRDRPPDRRRSARARGEARRPRPRACGRGASPTTSRRRIGNTGTAHARLLLADALDRAEPDQTSSCWSRSPTGRRRGLRTTEALAAHRRPQPVAAQTPRAAARLAYATFLTWRGFLDREPPRRPDPERPAAPRRRSAARRGSSASWAAAARRAARAICRRSASA